MARAIKIQPKARVILKALVKTTRSCLANMVATSWIFHPSLRRVIQTDWLARLNPKATADS
jgi:hypothetical protein